MMKSVSNRPMKLVLVGSLIVNVIVAIPALVLLAFSDGIRLYLHEVAATRFGETQIVFIGDSLTKDGGIWGYRIGQPVLEVRNLGHAALYTEQMAYQARSAVSDNAKLAFVMAGINDQPKSPEGAEASFRAYVQIIEILEDGGVSPVIQSTLYTENSTDQEFVTHLNKLLKSYADECGIAFLDLNRTLSSEMNLKSEFSRDGTHLNNAGYEAWAAEVRIHLEKSKTSKQGELE